MQDELEKFKIKRKLRSQIVLIVAAAVFIYMVVATIESVWQNYRINQDMARLKGEIAQLEEEQREMENLIAYLHTESFKEREARRKLGYRKPGEQVLAIPNLALQDVESGEAKENGEEEVRVKLTNPQKWWEYIFG